MKTAINWLLNLMLFQLDKFVSINSFFFSFEKFFVKIIEKINWTCILWAS